MKKQQIYCDRCGIKVSDSDNGLLELITKTDYSVINFTGHNTCYYGYPELLHFCSKCTDKHILPFLKTLTKQDERKQKNKS